MVQLVSDTDVKGGSAQSLEPHAAFAWPAPVAERLVVSTDAVPQRDRFDFYVEEVAGRHMKFDVSRPVSREPFNGRLEAAAAGDVFVSRVISAKAHYERSRIAIADGDDSALLIVLRKGSSRIAQGSLDVVVEEGSACLFHGAMPGTLTAVVGDNTADVLRVPGPMLARALRTGQSVSPRVFAAGDPVIGILSSYLTAFRVLPTDAAPVLRQSMGTHFADLAALALGASHDATEEIKGRGLKAASTEAVLKSIRENFAKAGISAAMVGLSLGITDRQVHRLLEETPKSFYEHVLECRLQQAHRLLRDPASLGLKVADIAFRAGFIDVTYFNRTFKTRFGETPTGVRTNAARPRLNEQRLATEGRA